jgi:hypothetical protein
MEISMSRLRLEIILARKEQLQGQDFIHHAQAARLLYPQSPRADTEQREDA